MAKEAKTRSAVPFLTNARLSRFMTSLLLCFGLLCPLLKTFSADSAMLSSVLTAAGFLVIFTVIGSFRKGRLWLLLLLGALAGVQLLLPKLGFFGDAAEAVKAIALYFNDVPGAAPLFASQIGVTLAVVLSVVCYAFSAKEAGFLPAAILVVLMLFGMWSLGRAQYLWLSAPSLVALLLLISQTSHQKINLFEVFPVSAVIVALALVLVPSRQVDIEPVYDAAMDAKQTIEDYLFFDDPRSIFTLGNYGYYPMGNGLLGGPAEQNDFFVMQVKTPKRVLLRAVSKDEYTGRQWIDTSGGNRYLYVNPRWHNLRQKVFLETLPPQTVRTLSHLLDEYAVSVLVEQEEGSASTIYTPAYLRGFSTRSDMVPYFNDSGELFATRGLQKGDSYTVIAPILEGGDDGLGDLVSTASRIRDDDYPSILAKYTRLPAHYTQGSDAATFLQQAQSIVSSASTPYEKACRIMNYLQGPQFRYTLTPSTPPEDMDFVTYFFFRSREGYCTYFASAMTVLCRMVGLPARYVEGFVAVPSADGIAYVTAKDAHAWTEVYFEGFGWVPFDATPIDRKDDESENPEPTPTPPPPENQPTPTPPPPEEEDPETPPPPDSPDTEPDDERDDEKPPFPWWILLILAVIGAFWLLLRRRSPDAVAARADTDTDRVFVYGNAAALLMRQRGRSPGPGETPMTFARRMDRQKAFAVSVTPLWRMMTAAQYSRRELNAEAARRAKQIYTDLYRSQHLFQKLRFSFAAAFRANAYTALTTVFRPEKAEKKYDYRSRLLPETGRKKKAKGSGVRSGDVFKPGPEWERNRAEQLARMDEARIRTQKVEAETSASGETEARSVPEPNPQPAELRYAPETEPVRSPEEQRRRRRSTTL